MPKQLKPQSEIRRFDVFAEWNRLKGRDQLKLKAGDARAYGLAVAKVVAGRSQKRASTRDEERSKPPKDSDKVNKENRNDADNRWWEHLGSDAEFKKTIVKRMGDDFYRDVFAPAVRAAWDDGAKYQDIRDTLRNEWNQ